MLHHLRRIIEISRPILWPATVLIFLFGVHLSGNESKFKELLYAFLWSFPCALWICSLNDLTDFESDHINKSKGGLAGAKVKKSEYDLLKYSAIGSGGILILSLFFVQSYLYWLCAVLGIILAYIYSFPPIRLKERPFLDSFSNGISLGLIFLCGYLFNGDKALTLPAIQSTLSLIMGVSALHIIFAIRDIEPDRKAGMKTIAVFLGAKRASLVTICLFCILFGVMYRMPILLRLLPVIGVILSFYLYRDPSPKRSFWVGLGVMGVFVIVASLQLLLMSA